MSLRNFATDNSSFVKDLVNATETFFSPEIIEMKPERDLRDLREIKKIFFKLPFSLLNS